MTTIEAYFEGETPKWKLAYILSENRDALCVSMVSDGRQLLVNRDDVRVPSYSHDYSRGFTYGLTHREYIPSECDEWRLGYIMGVVARVGA